MRFKNHINNKYFIRFIVFGFFNTVFSNFILFILLNFINVGIATLISAIVNAISGYFLGSIKIFERKGNPFKFFIFFIIAWFFQWGIISVLLKIGFTKFYTIALSMPILSLNSFLIQKKFVFN